MLGVLVIHRAEFREVHHIHCGLRDVVQAKTRGFEHRFEIRQGPRCLSYHPLVQDARIGIRSDLARTVNDP